MLAEAPFVARLSNTYDPRHLGYLLDSRNTFLMLRVAPGRRWVRPSHARIIKSRSARGARSGTRRGTESSRWRCRERWRVVWLSRACAVGMRHSWSSRTLAIAASRVAQQGEGARSRIRDVLFILEIRMRVALPGPGTWESYPAANFARQPEIRAVQ